MLVESISKLSYSLGGIEDENSIIVSSEILGKIFSFLDPITLTKTSEICKLWKTISEDEALWRPFLQTTAKLSEMMADFKNFIKYCHQQKFNDSVVTNVRNYYPIYYTSLKKNDNQKTHIIAVTGYIIIRLEGGDKGLSLMQRGLLCTPKLEIKSNVALWALDRVSSLLQENQYFIFKDFDDIYLVTTELNIEKKNYELKVLNTPFNHHISLTEDMYINKGYKRLQCIPDSQTYTLSLMRV